MTNLFINEIELAYFNFRLKLLPIECQQLPLLLISADKIVEGETVLYAHVIEYDRFRRTEVTIVVK